MQVDRVVNNGTLSCVTVSRFGSSCSKLSCNELPVIMNVLKRSRFVGMDNIGLDYYRFGFPLGEGTGFPYVFGYQLG